MSKVFNPIYTRVDGQVFAWNKWLRSWEFAHAIMPPVQSDDALREFKELHDRWDQLTYFVEADLIGPGWAGGPGYDVFVIAGRMHELGYIHPMGDDSEDEDHWVKKE